MAVRVLTKLASLASSSQKDGTANADLQQIVLGVSDQAAVETAVDAYTGVRVYRRGDSHPSYGANRIVSNVRPRQISPEHWEVDVTFEGQSYDAASTTNDLEWQWEIGGETIAKNEDYYGRPFLDRNGVPFQDPSSVQIKTLFLHVWKTIIYDVPSAWAPMTKVNAQPLALFNRYFIDKEQMMCWTIAPEGRQTRDNQPTRVKATFELRDGYKPFQNIRMQRSIHGWYDDGGNKLGIFCNRKGVEVQDPILINSNGEPISSEYRVTDGYTPRTPVVSPAQPAETVTVGSVVTPGQEVLQVDGVWCRTIQPDYGTYDFRGFIPGIM